MDEKTKIAVVEAARKAIPNPEQIYDVNVSDPDEVRMSWRANRFRLSLRTPKSMRIFCEEVDGRFLIASDIAALFGSLIEKELFS